MKVINKKYKMKESEMKELEALPDNMPENKLSKKQKDLVWNLYYKYIERYIDNYDYSVDLFMTEKKEKWACGKRTTNEQAKRFVLSDLLNLNKHYSKMTNKEASELFYRALTCKQRHSKLVSFVYDDRK